MRKRNIELVIGTRLCLTSKGRECTGRIKGGVQCTARKVPVSECRRVAFNSWSTSSSFAVPWEQPRSHTRAQRTIRVRATAASTHTFEVVHPFFEIEWLIPNVLGLFRSLVEVALAGRGI